MMKALKLKFQPNTLFSDASKRAKHTAIKGKCLVEFDFNGITCYVSNKTNTEKLLRDYDNAHTMDWLSVGPDCVDRYSVELKKEIEKKTKLKTIRSLILRCQLQLNEISDEYQSLIKIIETR